MIPDRFWKWALNCTALDSEYDPLTGHERQCKGETSDRAPRGKREGQHTQVEVGGQDIYYTNIDNFPNTYSESSLNP